MSIILPSVLGPFRWNEEWITLPEARSGQENRRTHGVVVSRDGRVFIFHQAVPSVLVYSPEGKLLDRWGDYPGAHGATLVEENGEEFLWLVDERTTAVDKVTLTGEIVLSLARPDHPAYGEGKYSPTWVAVNETRFGGTGDIWLADGYGSSLVHRYDAQGRYLLTLDGESGAGPFKTPHGIAFDFRRGAGELYIADRSHQRVQVFDGEGNFLGVFGADIFDRPNGFVFSNDYLIASDLRGRISILDAQDHLVEHLGANPAISEQSGWPDRTRLEAGKFNSPHGLAIAPSGDIYVVEWRAGGRVIKLERVS